MNPNYAKVAARAGHRCEYCHAPEAAFNFPFEVEHVRPVTAGGSDGDTNLALLLEPRQIARHAYFRWIRNAWIGGAFHDWAAFYGACHAAFEAHFDDKCLAPAGCRLANNLEFVLLQLAPFPLDIVDVLLYFHRPGQVPPHAVNAAGFQVVPIEYQPLNPGGWIDMEIVPL